MTVGGIKSAVRWCIDEEDANPSQLTPSPSSSPIGSDNSLMDNIIVHKIPDALRWVCLYAPAEQLSGSSSSGSGSGSSSSGIDIIHEELNKSVENGTNTLKPEKTLVRVVRVKGSSWNRAILGDSLIKEDSDEYLQLSDSNGAAATNDRPQAALMNTKEKCVEVFPSASNTFTLTYIRALTEDDISSISGETDINLPSSVETSFIYYLAYLVCIAYGDARAKNMFDVATMNLGRTDDKQRQ